jgi:uncharacterized protein YeaO (DUF488 family)
MIRLKRAYDPPSAEDGSRYLVDRLWPRGVRKDALALEAWLKDLAPTNELRRWFHHDPAHWEAFRQRYLAELEANPQMPAFLQQVAAARAAGQDVTLIYGAADREHNQAVVLKEFLDSHPT